MTERFNTQEAHVISHLGFMWMEYISQKSRIFRMTEPWLFRETIMAAILKVCIMSKIRIRQSMRIYLKNNPAKFYPDPIWNDLTSVAPVTTTTATRWVEIWDQFLIQKNFIC